jgi:cytidine deaminase
MDDQVLVRHAMEIRKNAYVPYSNFHVGAALLAGSGRVYTGCNVENSSYGATCCAERSAVFCAVSQGEREFQAIAVASDSGRITIPCGICLQVMIEFNIPLIIASNRHGDYKRFRIQDLIPYTFTESSFETD